LKLQSHARSVAGTVARASPRAKPQHGVVSQTIRKPLTAVRSASKKNTAPNHHWHVIGAASSSSETPQLDQPISKPPQLPEWAGMSWALRHRATTPPSAG